VSHPLDDEQLRIALTTLPGWQRAGNTIEKQFTAASFADGVTLLTRLAFEAEAADHHPDFVLEYRRLTVRYWTHTAGAVTQKDIDGARTTERHAGPYLVKDM